MARKANKKFTARKVTKRAGKKSKRAPSKSKKTQKVKVAKVRKSKNMTDAEAAAIERDNIAYGTGYLIP